LLVVCLQYKKIPRTKQNYLPHARNYVKQEAETIDNKQEYWKSGGLQELFFLPSCAVGGSPMCLPEIKGRTHGFAPTAPKIMGRIFLVDFLSLPKVGIYTG
jgi:hypothetical protein